METSIFIAKLVGPILVVTGLTALVNVKDMRAMGEAFIGNRALVYIAGFLAFLAGLAIVNTHNVWTGWPVIITLFGWIAIIGGIARMAMPALVTSIATGMLAKDVLLRVGGAVQLVLGAFLMFVGYF